MSKKRLTLTLLVVVVLVAGAIAWKVYGARSAFQAQVDQIVLDFEVELERPAPELGAFPARITAVEGWEAEPRLRRILARVYLTRGQPDRALDALQPLITVMTPEAEDGMLGGTAFLVRHQVAGGEELLRRAMGLFGPVTRLRPSAGSGNARCALATMRTGPRSWPGSRRSRVRPKRAWRDSTRPGRLGSPWTRTS